MQENTVLQESTQQLIQLPDDYYLVNHQQDLIDLLEDFEIFLSQKTTSLTKTKLFLKKMFKKALGIEKPIENFKSDIYKFTEALNQHKQALLLENAQLYQNIIMLEQSSEDIKTVLQELEIILLETPTSSKLVDYQASLLQQTYTINNAIIALNLTQDKNKKMVRELEKLTETSISVKKVNLLVSSLR